MRLARSYEELRGAGHRRLRQVHPRPGGGRRVAARGRLGGGGRRRGPPADDPRREGARVQGRDRRRRRPRHGGRAVDGRDPRRPDGTLRLPRDRSDLRQAQGRLQLRGGAGGREARGSRRAAAPLLRRDDACGRPPDRLRARSTSSARRIARRRSAGCSSGSVPSTDVERAAGEPVELERGEARFVLAVERWAPPLPEHVPRRRRRRRPARALRRAADRTGAARVPAARARAARCRAAAPRAQALLLGARALRALLVPLLRRAGRRAARGARHGAGRDAG